MQMESRRTLTDDCCMANNRAVASRRSGTKSRTVRVALTCSLRQPPQVRRKRRDHGDPLGEPELGMIAKLLLQNLIWAAGMGTLLFVPAGTLHWPAAWVFLGTIAILGVACGLWLAKTDPA